MKKTNLALLVSGLLLGQALSQTRDQAYAQNAGDNYDVFRSQETLSYHPNQAASLTRASAFAAEAGAKSGKADKLDKIPCIRWIDEAAEPRAVLLCIHGLGLHKGTYEDFGREMAKKGVVTYAIDMRGFGSWIPKQKNALIDFDGSLVDIKRALTEIRKAHPGLPLIMLGESMGGGIGIHATALYPDMIDGLISSVPSGDRFNSVDNGLKVGVHAIFGGFNKPIDIGPMVVGAATKKNDLRERWLNDPLCRTKISPNELISFQKFMDGNFDSAGMIKQTPVLFIMGSNDKLVRPVATFKLFDSLATPNKDKVMSNSAEHLIFEEGQFSKDDLSYINKWIDKKVLAKGKDSAEETRIAEEQSNSKLAEKKPEEKVALAAPVLVKPATTAKPAAASDQDHSIKLSSSSGMSYWIELNRGGKIYRCNNKMAFKSGDSIRFHIIPDSAGYAYIVMKEGSSGKKTILFPSKDTGTKNYLAAKTDYPLPKDWLTFDNTPGIEKMSLLFSSTKIASEKALNPPEYLTAYVSDDMSGSKDLVPTRMQLSWDDPTPVILPDQVPGQEKLASRSFSSSTGSLVKVSFNDPSGLMAVDVALAHQ
jgi:alpha-beta hydrolase superfamily lysophospholipase